MNTSFKIRKVSRLKWPILAAAQNTLRNVESKADWNVFTDRLPLGNIEAAARAVDVKLMSTPRQSSLQCPGYQF